MIRCDDDFCQFNVDGMCMYPGKECFYDEDEEYDYMYDNDDE